jgi:translocation and assembly module TamB
MLRRVLKYILLGVLLSLGLILLFLLSLGFYFKTDSGHKKLNIWVFDQLKSRLKTEIAGYADFTYPDQLSIQNLLIKDQKGDSLLYSREVSVSIDLLALSSNELKVRQISLDKNLIEVYRDGDSLNYEKVLAKINSESPKSTDSKSFELFFPEISISNTRLKFSDGKRNLKAEIGSLLTGFDVLDLKASRYELKKTVLSHLNVKTDWISEPEPKTQKKAAYLDLKLESFMVQDADIDMRLALDNRHLRASNVHLNTGFKLKKAGDFNLLPLIFKADSLAWNGNSKYRNSKKFNPGAFSLSQTQMAIKKSSGHLDSLFLFEKLTFSSMEPLLEEIKLDLDSVLINDGKWIIDGINTQVKNSKSQVKNLKLELAENKVKYTFIESKSQLNTADFLLFMPDLAKNPSFRKLRNRSVKIDASFSGSDKELTLNSAKVHLDFQNKVQLSGKINFSPKPKYDLKIDEWRGSKIEVQNWVKIENVNLPAFFVAKGKLKGDENLVAPQMRISSPQGVAKIEGKIDLKNENAKLGIQLENYVLGQTINQTDLGRISINTQLNIQDFKNPDIQSKSSIKQVEYQGKTYKNLSISSSGNSKSMQIQLQSAEKGLELDWDGELDLSGKEIVLKGNTQIRSINLKELGLLSEDLLLSGDLQITEFENNSQLPQISLKAKLLTIEKNGKKYPLRDLYLQTKTQDSKQQIRLKNNFADLNIKGDFDLMTISNLVLQELNRYFYVQTKEELSLRPGQYIDLKANISYDSSLKVLDPKIQAFEPFSLETEIHSGTASPISGYVNIKSMIYDSIRLKDVELKFDSDAQKINYELIVAELLKQEYRIRNASLDGFLANNKADFNLAVKNDKQEKLHALKGVVSTSEKGLKVNFDESGTLLSGTSWSGNPFGELIYSSEGVLFHDVVFSNGPQIMRVNSLTDIPNGPILLFADQIDLQAMAQSFLRDSSLVSGKAHLDLEVVEYMGEQASFSGDFGVDDFTYLGKPLGKLYGVAHGEGAERIQVFAELKDAKHDLEIKGTYTPKNIEQLDFDAEMRSFDAATLSIWTTGVLDKTEGNITGKFKLKGSTEKPQIRGDITVQKMKTKLVETGAWIQIDKQKLNLTGDKLSFKNFRIDDINSKSLTLNGWVDLKQLPDYSYELKCKGSDFTFIDAKEGESKLYKGLGQLDLDILLTGKNLKFKCTGDAMLKKGTDLTLLLEEEISSSTELNSIVRFKLKEEKAKVSKDEKSEKLDFRNAVNMIFEVAKEAKLNILMDAVTGDLLTAYGKGKFNVGFDNKGELFMIGKYDIEKGKYNLTYQVISKEFNIDQNSESSVTFTGNPMEGQLKVTATYDVPGKKNIMVDKGSIQVPVRVDLNLSGIIEKPNVIFDLVVKDPSVVAYKTSLESLGYKLLGNNGKKQEVELSPSLKTEISNRAVMVLLTGTLSSEQLLSNFTKSEDIENVARQKASELLSSTLSNYASGIIKGLDLDLGLDSKVNAGGRNTNLSFGISKKVANDRLLLKVGKNFELENSQYRSDEIFDNLQANWLITKDGRYRLNIFRKNLNDLVIEGQVIETGLGFALALDYEQWADLKKRALGKKAKTTTAL